MTRRPLFAAAGLLAAAAAGRGDITPASPFTDHMVLQRGTAPVWGTADPGEAVAVSLGDQTRTATAGADGKWAVRLTDLKAGGPFALTIKGKNTVTLADVLVGEVWLCSGQSNMDFTVAKTPKFYFAGIDDEAKEVAAANHPQIRMFTGEWTRAYEPRDRVAGTWKVCTPGAVREFSAVGYFFARDLQKELNVPVGIITLTYGASCAQAWVRREAIAADPRLKPVLDTFDAQVKGYKPPPADEVKKWEAAAAAAKAAGRRAPRPPGPQDPVQDQHNPTVMYNGMVAPVVPYGVKGFLWYQGESITGPRELFPRFNETLVKDWRTLWGGDPPFYFCQLAAHGKGSGNLPQTREMQAEALKLPNTGMAVTIDVGDPTDVHPHNKQAVGARLARIALARDYGKDIEYSGPVYESMRVEGAAARLTFAHLGGGLVAKGGPLKTFEAAGPDGKFAPAEATIDGGEVVVTGPAGGPPAAVRYAWSAYAEGCNLFNAAGLPAAPFRTDKK